MFSLRGCRTNCQFRGTDCPADTSKAALMMNQPPLTVRLLVLKLSPPDDEVIS